MDYWYQGIGLAIDSAIFGICLSLYSSKKTTANAVKQAPVLELNEKLIDYVQSQPQQRIPYCAIRGTIAALGVPIHSVNSKTITGVVQKLILKQHVVTRSSTGFWTEHERTIHEIFTDIPFVIRSSNANVEVLEALSAEMLDLETISDHFEPTQSNLGDHLWGFFSGIRQQGMQSTEEMLREGALITAIGKLSYDSDFKDLRIQPSLNGNPYFLTPLPLTSVVQRLNSQKELFKGLAIISGGVGVLLACLVAKRWWKAKRQEQIAAERQLAHEASRRARRSGVRDRDLPEDMLCVVCRENPKEIILLPCGHVCLCEDCSEGIDDLCPVCRRSIDTRAAAYLT